MLGMRLPGEDPELMKLKELLIEIYNDKSAEEINHLWLQLLQILDKNIQKRQYESKTYQESWDSSSAILITYADVVKKKGEPTLTTLKKLIDDYIGDFVPIIHILPFLSSTSDGGFAVSSYECLEPGFGTWDNLNDISKKYILMADLVLNHVSSSHPWVQGFIRSIKPESNYIFVPEAKGEWKNVTRPRNTSLFTQIKTVDGPRDVWTTFGPDQIDINWKEPNVIIEFFKLLIRYVNSGIAWIRLDAVGFIWKESKTTCLHLEEVHKLVKVFRILFYKLNKSGVLITETNVPEKENISYLKDGDEAHLAYNFALPPLLLEAIISNNADLLNRWLCNWPNLPLRTGFLNFTSSHDGVGLRALEGLMSYERILGLLVSCEKRGGLVSHRRMPDGSEKPYELNISWWSAMSGEGRNSSLYQLERFLLSQLFVMSLKGIPAFYLQSLLASENDHRTFAKSGQRRDINREKFDANTLNLRLQDEKSDASRILKVLKNAMLIRRKLKAFHPDQSMDCLSNGRSDIVIIHRGKGDDSLWAIHNMTSSKLCFSLRDELNLKTEQDFVWKDYLEDNIFSINRIELEPYSVKWLMKTT